MGEAVLGTLEDNKGNMQARDSRAEVGSQPLISSVKGLHYAISRERVAQTAKVSPEKARLRKARSSTRPAQPHFFAYRPSHDRK